VTGTVGTVPRPKEAETHPVPVNEGDAGDDEVSQEASDALVRMISNHWTKGYEILGPTTTTAGMVKMGVSFVELLAGMVARATVLYTQKGPGPWMLAALWGTAFQIFTMPTQWALEWGEVLGRVISRQILSRVVGADLPTDGGGSATNS
jgi:hypothetical protein